MFQPLMLKKNQVLFKILYFLTIVLLLLLPYYLFQGRLFIGGDDTRLFYVYPKEFIYNLALFSWSNFSSLSYYLPNHQYLPFLSMWSIVDSIIKNKIVLDYLAFSLPMILAFIYFQKFVGELSKDKNSFLKYIATLFYILSPITIVNQLSVFLTSIWLLPLIPIMGFYFIRYIKTSRLIYIIFGILFSITLSIGLYSIPWMFGMLLPLILGSFLYSVIYSPFEIKKFLKKTTVFLVFIGLSHLFWIIPLFFSVVLREQANLGSRSLSGDVQNTFIPTVLATATGNILYPLMNLFHRQIAFDFDWALENVFMNFYDKIFLLNFFFIVLFFLGIIAFSKLLRRLESKAYLYFLLIFLISLYFFTVNIGPFKNLFLLFNNIPGFVMFRNFYDKFALGYIFFYSVIVFFSLLFIKKAFPKFYLPFIGAATILVILNFLPAKDIINGPLWTTKDIYKDAIISNEYLLFLEEIRRNISSTSNILSLPFNSAAYSIIGEDKSSNHFYIGTSPVKFLTGINDLSGGLSFPPSISSEIIEHFINKDYQKINVFLERHNVNYVLVTKNIPDEVKKSYLYDSKVLESMDNQLIDEITGKKILISEKGNYELYVANNPKSLISSRNVTFQKVNPTKYRLYVSGLKKAEDLLFLEPYHGSWKLFLEKNPDKVWCDKKREVKNENIVECEGLPKIYQGEEIGYLFKESVFDKEHSPLEAVNNKWIVDPEEIKRSFGNSYYSKNKDGSINIEMTLYFKPQSYFYLGTILSSLSVITVLVLTKRSKNA